VGKKSVVAVGLVFAAGKWRCERALVFAAAGLLALGCSSGARESDKSPSAQCQDYETRYCAKAVACQESSDRADFGDACDFSFQVHLPCARVNFVAADTQPCLDAIDAIECVSVAPGSYPDMPLACQMLFGSP
jgi:hypothetical protein